MQRKLSDHYFWQEELIEDNNESTNVTIED